MFDFSAWVDLPLIWGVLVSVAVLMYVLLDGYDLGCGIISPLAPSESCRNKLMNSMAPFWDANETWLILAAGGLFVAFPLAYAVLMPAFYMPVSLMLIGLIFRGVAFELRYKATDSHRKYWDRAFHGGSLLAAFMQGIILGNFVQGVEVAERAYAGGPLDWANGFSIVTGLALVFGYALLGATWLVMKTDGTTQKWARKVATYVSVYVLIAMAVVSITVPFMDETIAKFWFSTPNIYYLSPIPALTLVCFVGLWRELIKAKCDYKPFVFTAAIFLLGFVGLGISLYPWIVPFAYTVWDAAAATTSLSLLLVGAVIMLPVILAYTAFCYYLFWGKSGDEHAPY